MTKIIHLFSSTLYYNLNASFFLFIVSVMQVEAQQVVLMVDSEVGHQVDPAPLAKGAGLC